MIMDGQDRHPRDERKLPIKAEFRKSFTKKGAGILDQDQL